MEEEAEGSSLVQQSVLQGAEVVAGLCRGVLCTGIARPHLLGAGRRVCPACLKEEAVRSGMKTVVGMVRSSQRGCPFGSQVGHRMASEMLSACEFQKVVVGGGVVGCTTEQMAKRIAGVCGVPLSDGAGGGLLGCAGTGCHEVCSCYSGMRHAQRYRDE